MLLSRTVFGLELTCTRISAFVSDCKSSSAIKLRKMNKIERRNIKARSTKRHYWPRPLFPSLAGARIEQAAVPCTNDVIPGRSKMATACVRQAKSASGHKQDRFSTGEEGGGENPDSVGSFIRAVSSFCGRNVEAAKPLLADLFAYNIRGHAHILFPGSVTSTSQCRSNRIVFPRCTTSP